MKNLAVITVVLVIVLFLIKNGIDRYLEENERHNKFLEDRIDRDGLGYLLTVDPRDEVPSEIDEEIPKEEEVKPVISSNGVVTSDNGVISSANSNGSASKDVAAAEPAKYLAIEKVSEAVQIIFDTWNLKENAEFKKDLAEKNQIEFVKEYVKDILGDQIRIQFGLSSKKGGIYAYYKRKGFKTPLEMSEKILIQLYKHARNQLNLVK